MVLTERQRKDLHSGIFEYLLSQEGELWEAAASAFQRASETPNDKKAVPTPLLEKKWTAIPRLQKKVLELERLASQQQKIHAHRTGGTTSDGGANRRMLPRLPCTHTLQGHSNVVTTVQVHPVFTLVVSGSEDGTIKVWDHETGEYIRTLKGHTNTVTSLAFTPTGTHLASSSTDLSIKLWDFTSYNCIRTLRGHDHTISAVAFLPLLEQPTAISSGEKSSSQTGMDTELAGSQFVVSCSRDKTVKVWDVETGFCEQTITDHHDWVRCISVRNSDGTFCTSGNDTVIYVYNGNDRSKRCELRGHESVIESVGFICETFEGSKKMVKAGIESRDLLVSGGRDRSVRLWKISAISCLATFMAHDNWVRSVLLHPSGNFIISAGDDRTIRVMDIKAQRCLRTLDAAHPHFVSCLSMHPTLPILVSGGVDTTLKCWMLE